MSQKITTFLTFNDQAEEAVAYYCDIFPGSKILSKQYYAENMPGLGGKLMSATFELFGQTYYALNAGPHFQFTEAISLFISCEDQAEVDRYWDALVAGGKEDRCGWLKDKYGVSWQVIPKQLGALLSHPDKAKASRAMQSMMGMRKIDIAALEAAAGE
jgi:predicted 3-demethylubiquinone-9 3-methyltransferase (glyoxalase superfamily)